MYSSVRPNSEVVLRLPSGILKIVKVIPNTTISIPKIGTFSANLLLGRPYHFTYEILDLQDGSKETGLRIVPVDELNLEVVTNKTATPAESRDDEASDLPDTEINGQNGERNNRLTVDDPSRQALTMEEIEELKKANPGSGKEIIEQIMASHSGLKEKTAFALAKYTLRKSRKYMKRFTMLPLDVNMLTEIMLEKDPSKIMELREEMLGLIMSWSNVHYAERAVVEEDAQAKPSGRWLVVDDTCGLVVAAMAERMGLLYQDDEDDSEDESDEGLQNEDVVAENIQPAPDPEAMQIDERSPDIKTPEPEKEPTPLLSPQPQRRKPEPPAPQQATSNTITVLHSNPQPNLSFLKYFSFTPEDLSTCQSHPLYSHLKTVTWLQLLNPSADALYQEPPAISDASLAGMKSGKRGNYYRKRNRWERIRKVVDETREGGFDGLVVASTMEPVGIMKHCVPLVKGGGNIVVYSPSAEPLVSLMDIYSRDRKGAYVRIVQAAAAEGKDPVIDEEVDFPLNPTLLLNPMLQTARAREWQVLPGRTHPLMTSKGGPEGYLFTATRVLPNTSVRVEARGRFGKKKKMTTQDEDGGAEQPPKKAKTDQAVGGAEIHHEAEGVAS
ncbi:Gcd10p-domain-containing protein [Tothia fuscella]|uniref:tRNA (adenine(58)-N(1))-methyltransferase non-catalytic subunit TRM6 n=1 Tax=Tothia fuscella TaxID=1048955 RepID=A0A9P4NKJ7_9PEZI|nr:Gcd10p-domain-containing protein [Tothia fuscella]